MREERLSLESNADREELARLLVRASERPVAWCVLDWASEATAAVTDVLVASWGPGLCYQPGVPWADATRPAVLPKVAASRILRAAKTRVWSSESEVPEPRRVMESLEHGCLPLQLTPLVGAGGNAGLSEAFGALLLSPDPSGALRPFSDEELKFRLDAVAAALATGQLERDLSDQNG